jgi:5'-3' exonuclease
MNEELLKAFNKFKQAVETTPIHKNPNDNVLILDGTNMFIRSWSVNPIKDTNGEYIGGAIGFLKSLGYLSGLIKPTRIIIAFDGKGGSLKRKSKFEGYKSGRAFSKRSSSYHDMEDQEAIRENMIYQFEELIKFLKFLPVRIISIDHIEADDVIAYLANNILENKVTIASSDNDYLQLINERISLYSPQLKRIIDQEAFKEIRGYRSENYIWEKCILGDKSDSVPNIKSVGSGLFSIIKEFLNNDIYDKPSIFLEKLDEYILLKKENEKENKTKNKFLKLNNLIKENEKQFRCNFDIMQLKDVDINNLIKLNLNDIIHESIQPVNIVEFRQKLIKYSFQFDYKGIEGWFQKNFQTLIIK